MNIQNKLAITEYFDKIYIINLPERTDRLKEVEEQFKSINLTTKNKSVYLYPAVRPTEPEEFDSIGTKGCFLSHLNVLKDASEHGYKKILILEDDVNFSRDFLTASAEAFNLLRDTKWDIFYGGHRVDLNKDNNESNIQIVPPSSGVGTSHCVAFQGEFINKAINELELMLSRKNGDPNGGPMHVDGAYSTIRKNHPQYTTFAAFPELAYQRLSKTDIHALRWFDRIFLIRSISSTLRKLKNTFSSA